MGYQFGGLDMLAWLFKETVVMVMAVAGDTCLFIYMRVSVLSR